MKKTRNNKRCQINELGEFINLDFFLFFFLCKKIKTVDITLRWLYVKDCSDMMFSHFLPGCHFSVLVMITNARVYTVVSQRIVLCISLLNLLLCQEFRLDVRVNLPSVLGVDFL